MAESSLPRSCSGCGTQIAPNLLACPVCRQLLHADELKRLAAEARRATSLNDLAQALAHWRAALELLPPNSRQHAMVLQQIDQLSRSVDAGGARVPPPVPVPAPPALPSGPPSESNTSLKKGTALGGILIAAGALLWKLKAVVFLVLSKLKFLAMGLKSASTSLSMLASFGVYWQIFGWKFAAGLVLSIYVHEMGHVYALRRYGIPATAPMFIPGLGALIRLKQYPHSAREAARVGLAGPIAGLIAAATSYAVYWFSGAPIWAAIAHFGGLINLFNLAPVLSLDGSHGFRAMLRWHRWLCVAVLVAVGVLTQEGLCYLLAIIAGFRASMSKPTTEPDRFAVLAYVGLVISLGLIAEAPIDLGDMNPR